MTNELQDLLAALNNGAECLLAGASTSELPESTESWELATNLQNAVEVIRTQSLQLEIKESLLKKQEGLIAALDVKSKMVDDILKQTKGIAKMAQDYDKIERTAVNAALEALGVDTLPGDSLGHMVNTLAASVINGFFDMGDHV